ncbi:hypothetical protein AB9M10_17985 [Rhodococcus erythropolis]
MLTTSASGGIGSSKKSVQRSIVPFPTASMSNRMTASGRSGQIDDQITNSGSSALTISGAISLSRSSSQCRAGWRYGSINASNMKRAGGGWLRRLVATCRMARA